MKHRVTIILLVILLVGVYWLWWLPGPRVATDFSLLSSVTLKSYLDYPQTWTVKGTEGLGEYPVFTLWAWPFNFLYSFFANLGLSFATLQRFLIIIPFLVIGGLGIWKLCIRINLSIPARVIAILFYLTNTYILLVIDGGQLSISLVYALFPLGFLAIEDAIIGNLKKKIFAGLLVFLMGVFDIRFIYIFSVLCFIRFSYEFLFLSPKKWLGWILSWLKTGGVVFIILLGLNAYWLLVIFKYPISTSQYLSLTKTSFTSFISFPHALILLSPHWFRNVFGYVTPIRFEFLFIPVLVFLAPLLKSKNRSIGFWLLVAVVSIFLTKGSSEPLPQIYQWFYYNIPGFSLFRDSSKFFFLLSLSYTILIGVTIDEVIKRVNSFKIKIAFLVTLVAYFAFLSHPVWLNLMTGTFSPPRLQKEYSQLNNFISNDQTMINVVWIPTISPLTNLDPHHPSIDAARLAQKRPFIQATKGTYELLNFLREASYMGQLFEVANIKYLVYPPLNPQRDALHPDNIKYYDTFLHQLSKLPWLSRVENLSIPTLQVKQYQDKFFLVPNTWWVIGSDSIYNEAAKSAKLSLSKNALIFAEESIGLGKRIDEIPNSKIVLYKKHSLDLAASFINNEDLIFPAKELNYDPTGNGWWKRETSDFPNFRVFLNTKYLIDNQDFDLGGGWAIGEGNRKLKIDNGKLKIGNVLLARVLESSRSGSLSFSQDDNLIGQVDTKKPGNNIRWFEVGTLTDDEELIISTTGDINVVNTLAAISPAIWDEYKNKVNSLKDENRVVNFDPNNVNEEIAKVSYKQLSPTKYTLYVQNLNNPTMLIFSQNFDRNWKLNGQTPFPIYSLLNGFRIEKSGQYDLEFEPQKFILPGLVISAITLFTALVLLLV